MGSRPNSQRTRNRGMRSPYQTVFDSNGAPSSNKAKVKAEVKKKAEETYKQYAKGNENKLVRQTKFEKKVTDTVSSFASFLNRNGSRTAKTLAKDFRTIGRSASNLARSTSDKSYSYSYSSASGYSEAGEFARELHDEQIRPKNMVEAGQVAAARDTATDRRDYYEEEHRSELSRDWLGRKIDSEYHNEMIGWGQNIMYDQEAINDWILAGGDEKTINERIDMVNDYFDNALHYVEVFDPSLPEGYYGPVVQQQIKADAELPPWILANRETLNRWDYYKTYSHDVVDAARRAHIDAGEMARQRKLHPYTSAFATAEEAGRIDSFLDVAVNAISDASQQKAVQALPHFAKSLIKGTGAYLKEYAWNPLVVGYNTGTLKDSVKTVAGNAVWNFMETSDYLRGTRAFIAGQRRLGGETDIIRSFTDADNEFWITLDGHSDQEARIAQDMFMKNGGRELIADLRRHRLYGAQNAFGVTDEDYKARLDKAFSLDSDLVKGIKWEEVYDAIIDQYINTDSGELKASLQRGLANVKETYTNPDAKFEADTGNLAADIMLETVLDPSIMVGGLARNFVKGSTESAATNSMRKGFAEVFKDADKAEAFIRNKNIRQYIRSFINSNEGKNIIFKDLNNLDDDVTSFIMKVNSEDPTVFADPVIRDQFRRTVVGDLSGKMIDTNANIIASTSSFRDRFNYALLKSAYYTDKAFDGIDSAIIKSSFIVPWAGVKGIKAGYNHAITSETVGKAINRLNLKRKNALNVLISEKTGSIDVTNVPKLMSEYNKGMHNEAAIRSALQHVVDRYDDVAWKLNDVIRKFSRGEITDEEALELVGKHISDITGGKYNSLDALKGFIEKNGHRYRGDLAEAYQRIDNTFNRLKDFIDHRSEDAVDEFLEKVRGVKSEDELARLVREYMDNDYVMSLRREVVHNSKYKISLDDYDDLVNKVRNGLFSEESITRDAIQQGTDVAADGFKDVVSRTVDYDQFESMLDRLDVNWRGALDAINHDMPTMGFTSVEKKLANFMSGWTQQKDVTYTIDDALRFIDRMERQVHFKQLMNIGTASEVSALVTHKEVAEFNKLRRMIKKIDLISLKDVKYVLIPQMDRMALNLNFRNHKDIQNLYGSFYDEVIDPIWKELKRMSFDESDPVESSLFDDIDQLARQKFGFDRTSQLIEQAKTLPGFSDDHLHSFLNTLATDFRFRDDLGNIDLSPGSIRRRIEATLRAQTGQSKVGMKNITDSLLSIDSNNPNEFLEPYIKVFEKDPDLKETYLKYVGKDVLDPSAYVEKQMLYTVLADPSIIDDWNKMAKFDKQPPIMFHINTTGLNNEINSMTSISFRQWVPMDIPKTPDGAVDNEALLRSLLDNLEKNDTTVIQRRMTDDEFEEITEQVMRSLDMKDCDPSNIRKRYKEVYGITDDAPYKSELEMMEEACDYIRQFTRLEDENGVLNSVAPSLVVHDLDGFNINYFNNKVIAMRDIVDESSALYDYAERIAKSVKYNSRNTYQHLAEKSGDIYFTDDQIERITELVQDYVDDINHRVNDYRFNDMQTYSRKLHDIVNTLELKREANQLTETEAKFLAAFDNASGSSMLKAYDKAVKDITALGLYPRQYAFLSTGLEDNLTKMALKATGRDTVNVNTRIYVDDVLSYFNLETEDGIYATVEDLRKMNNVAKYIRNARERQIVAGADVFLEPYKDSFDRVIQSVIDIAHSNSYDSTSLSYLKDMRIPDNAIDSYLLAKKLYNDHLKYWLDTDSLTSLSTDGRSLDAMKQKLSALSKQAGYDDPEYLLERSEVFSEASDYYNNHRVRLFDELVGGGFDNLRLDEVEALAKEQEADRELFWRAVSDDIKQIWGEFKEENASRWADVSKNSKETWQAFKDENAERWKEVSEKAKEKSEEFKRKNKEAKETMVSENKAEYANYRVFKDFLDDLYKPAFEAIEEGFKAFRLAKEEKWDYFFGVVKPERDHLDNLIKQAGEAGDRKAVLELREQRAAINDEWQKYNKAYMDKWFTNVSRDRAYEPYKFKDQKLAEQYSELERRERSYRKLYAERKKDKFLKEANAAKAEMERLARSAENYENRRGWLQWNGDHVLSDVEKQLSKEYHAARHGTLDPDHSILFSNNTEVKDTYRQFVKDGYDYDTVKRNTEHRYVDYRMDLEDRFNEMYHINSDGQVVRHDLEGEIVFQDALLDTEDEYNRVVEKTNAAYNAAIDESEEAYEEAQLNSAIRYREAEIAYDNLAIWQVEQTYDRVDNLRSDLLDKASDVLDLLQGAHEAEIFNWAARPDYEKTVLSVKDGVLKSGLDKAAKYIECGSQIKSNVRQLQHIDDYYASAGLLRKQDRLSASMHVKASQLFDILEQTKILKRESFQDFIRRASEINRVQLQEYRLRSLRNADGAFDENKLLSELVYNGFNMTVFNAHNYEPKDIEALRDFVQDLQKKHDFLSYYEDNTTGNVFVYLNNNCVVSEANGFRYINRDLRFERPLHDVVPYAEFDDLVQMMNIDDIEDFRGIYAHLRSCWEDTRMLSLGQINGTTGKVVSHRQAEEFIQTLPSNMGDWLTSEGLLRDEIARDVIYDPGFVINEESDMLMDFLGTFTRQAEVAKDDAIIINEVLHNTGNIQFGELARNFPDDELIEYFGKNPEYVVCTVTAGDNTATGFAIKQLNLSTKAGLQAAKTAPNTTVLPYDAYYELANYMNRSINDPSIAKRILGKYMLVYKAFALAKPGTWMRNFIDATSKAAFDNNGGINDVADMLRYEARATKSLGDYARICKTDPSLLTPANWDIVQQTYKTDMTFEDFELLRGVIDSTRYKSADMYFFKKTTDARQGYNIISGQNIGLRNLEYDDISKAYDKYLSNEFYLPLSKKEFLDAYMNKAADIKLDAELDEQFEDMFRKLSNNLRNGSAPSMFDKTIDTMFKPFGTVEHVVRYAQALKLRDNGFSSNQITRHIHDTQFYNAPVWGTWHKLETIMPFITFKMNNMMYWIRMMDENPRLFRYFADTYRSVYDTTLESALEEGVELDYANDYGLQSGALPFGNGHRYLNVGNSFLSAMNDFYGFPFDVDSLNPLLKATIKGSAYSLGLGSGRFMDETEAQYQDLKETLQTVIPGYTLARKGVKTFKNIANISTTSGGPSMDVLCSTLGFLGIVGTRYQYDMSRDGSFSFEEWQEELAEQGKWYDANLGKVVDISLKNEFGANDPANSFRDVQTYMMVHFGKVWDANQNKFVKMEDYQSGGLNLGFKSWEELSDYMRAHGKKWDANQRKFVYMKDFISGGLNAENLEWEIVVSLMEEKFPNLKWDANQQAFVEKRYYIEGGLNDAGNFREVMGLRLALYGETYNKAIHKFEKTQDSQIVMLNRGYGKKYDGYYAMLAIPNIKNAYGKLHATSDGLLMTEDGKYVLTGNADHDRRVFDKFRYTFSGGGRRYHGYKKYSYNKTRIPKKPYKGRTFTPSLYQTGYGWNAEQGYYREAFEYSYQYHSPQPGAKLNRLISPPRFYPYGGGYSKFSFQNRY